MITFDSQIGLYVSANKLQMVEVNYTGREYLLENVDEAYFDEQLDLVNDKESKSIALLQAAFNEMLIRKPLRTKRAAVSLPAETFYIQQFPYDNTLIEEDIIAQFKWELGVLYPNLPIDDLVIDHFRIEKNLLLNYNNAIVVAFPRKCLKVIQNFCKKNSLYFRFADYSHFASDKNLELISGDFNNGWYISVLITGNSLSLEVLLDGKPVFIKLFKEIEAQDIVRQINIIINKSGLNIKRDIFKGMIVWGDEVSNQTLSQLEDQLRIKCLRINPFAGLSTSKALAISKYLRDRSYGFAPAAGIAYRLF
ncbi:MAG: pilus assembly protein PilM [Ignavibacteriaceae bacterium]|nr:pilus assembly protein PilM [Ignavibacteriaceae bacterium]